MSDKYYIFENFRYGLDSRKSVLTELPGTLLQAVNGFVNSGGEVEQRKSFAQIETAVHNDLPFPANCFGLQDTDSGLVTFGSDAAPSGTLPTGVTYQRLRPPHATALPVMSSIVFSCNYLGKAFVLAKFNDNSVYVYYNGTIIPASANGIVTLGETLADLSTDLTGMVNGVISGWLADANKTASVASDSGGYHETALNGSTLLMSPASVHFIPTTSKTSAAGQLGAILVDQNYNGVAAIAARVAFTISGAGPGTFDVAVGALDLTGGTVAFNGSLNQTAIDIATAINNLTFVTGYSAVITGATVTVVAPTNLGNFTGAITVTPAGGTLAVAAGPIQNQFVLTLTPPGLAVSIISTGGHKVVSGSIAASIAGAIGAVTFKWSETNADGTPVTTPSGILMSPSDTASTVTFSKSLAVNESVIGYFKCVATDTGGPPNTTSTIYFLVQLDSSSPF